MRYEDWDVLLFPKDSKIPMKEFKSNCHVVHDTEFAYTHGSFGLPTMTCFMPGLSPGTQFNISLHCWKTPEISQFTRSYSKHPELVKFEARVLVDGRLVSYVPDCSIITASADWSCRSASFSRTGPWPQLINHSFEFTKNGDLEVLRFPQFRSEVLRQSYWSPADEIGRIKVIISEGFPRDSLTVPIERVKNIIAFSFQHAPLDILESSGIAWPNPAMWRRSPFNPTVPVPSEHQEDGPDSHLHSPRRRASLMKSTSNSSSYGSAPPGLTQCNTNNFLGSMPNTQAFLQRSGIGSSSGYADQFGTPKSDAAAYMEWANSLGPYTQTVGSDKSCFNPAPSRKITGSSKAPHTDATIPDFGLANSNNMQGISDSQLLNFSGTNLEDADFGTQGSKAPTNTPTTMGGTNFVDELGIDVGKISTPGSMSAHYLNALISTQQARTKDDAGAGADKQFTIDLSTNDFFNNSNTNFSSELATSLTHSLLNQPHPLPVQAANIPLPAPEVKSRKENRLNQDMSNDSVSSLEHVDMRKVSQSSFCNSGREGRDTNSNNSPPSQRTFSGMFSQRSASTGEFGNDLTNIANAFTHPDMTPNSLNDASTSARVVSGSEKGLKRIRRFTPTSNKAIDDEDQPRTRSPSIQIELDDQLADTI
ncbi:hypothetical protein F5B20DRAFT_494173 [Whalleya microplaca]|nr:hypothetical protein F5B20DRAFT_494173 [Whalleya microplaca]